MAKKSIVCALTDSRVISDIQLLERECQTVFTPNSEQAVNALALNDFDAIVTDFKPDPTFEVPLLTRVLNRFPQVIRIMLLDPASKGSIKTDGSAHQYLTKPCSKEVLLSAIDRAQLIKKWLSNSAIAPLMVQMKKLPSVPAIYLRLMKQLQSPETSLPEIAAIIAEDFNLTARLLQMVNSAAFGLGHTVATPEEAVGFLGIERIKGLVLVASALATADPGKGSSLSVDELWQHSVTTAKLARLIARENGNTKSAEEAFTAGLLHDVGKLLLAVNMTETYNTILQRSKDEGEPLDAVEQKVLGVTHTEIGACVLGTWGIPAHIVAAIAFHHAPDKYSEGKFDTTTAVHVANGLAHGWSPNAKNVASQKLDVHFLKEIGLGKQMDSWQQHRVAA